VIPSATAEQDGGANFAGSAVPATPAASDSGQMLVGCFSKPQVFMASVGEEEVLHNPATYQEIAAWLQIVVG
jgi:hypothetical protein